MTRLGVAHLTALDLPPGDFARRAAAAGFASIGLRFWPIGPGAPSYPTRTGTRAHAELKSILSGEGRQAE